MVIWFMMKPILHLCIKDLESVEINISEPNITLLNLISHFKNHHLGIGKSSHRRFNIPYECWSYHAMSLIWNWDSDYLENVLFEKMTIS